MLIAPLAFLFVGFVLYFMSHWISNISKLIYSLSHRILKQVMITFALFNVFNVTFSTVTYRLHNDSHYTVINTLLIVIAFLSILLPLLNLTQHALKISL